MRSQLILFGVLLSVILLVSFGIKVEAKTPNKVKTSLKTPTPKEISSKAATNTRTRTRTSTRTNTKTATATPTQTATQTFTATQTLTPSSTFTPSKTPTRSKSPTRTIRPSRTPVPALLADISVDDDETVIFVPVDEDICEGANVGGLSNVVVQFTQSYEWGIPVTGGRCYTSGNYDVLTVYFDSLSRGKDYTLRTLPVWVATATNTRTHTPTSTYTPTMTSTSTSTPTITPSPTITVIPNFRIDLEYIGSRKLRANAGNVCVVGSIYWLETITSNVVVEFTEDLGSSVTITDARCSARGYSATDVLNFLTRNGETIYGTMTIP